MSLGLIKEYNPDWPGWFREIKDFLEPAIQGLYLSIEHVGSTSVAGMNAKPIIDLDIVIIRDSFADIRVKLENIGYVFLGDLGVKGREFFALADAGKKKDLPEHHLYVCREGEFELKKHLAFRDYLRNNEPARIKLMELKRELEESCQTRQEYIDRKSGLVQEITTQALKEY